MTSRRYVGRVYDLTEGRTDEAEDEEHRRGGNTRRKKEREREKQRGRNEGELRKGGEVKSEKGKHYPPTQLGTDLEIPQIKSALRLGPADVSIMAVLSLSLSRLYFVQFRSHTRLSPRPR